MKLQPIIRELRAECGSFSGRVFGIAEYAQITESMAPEALPAAFVIPVSDEPDDPITGQRYLQDVTFNFEVVVMVSNVSDEQGLSAWDAADQLKSEVFRAILGSDDASLVKRDWIEYRGFRDIERTRAYLAVPLEFAAQYRIEDSDSRHGLDVERLGRFLRMFADIDLLPPDGRAETKLRIEFDNQTEE